MTKKREKIKATLRQLQIELSDLSEVNPPLSTEITEFLLQGIERFLAKPNVTLEVAFFPGKSGRPKGPAARSLERADKIEAAETNGQRSAQIARALGVSSRDPSRIKRRTAKARAAETSKKAAREDADALLRKLAKRDAEVRRARLRHGRRLIVIDGGDKPI